MYFHKKRNSKYQYIAEIRSMSEETGTFSISSSKKFMKSGKLVYSLPYITQDIPVGIVFKALGVDISELKKFNT